MRCTVLAARAWRVCTAMSIVMSRTSVPETGDAVVATRMLDCDRDMSYP